MYIGGLGQGYLPDTEMEILNKGDQKVEGALKDLILKVAKDVAKAPGLKNKFLYIVMPPGWSHTGDHKTARMVKRSYTAASVAGQENNSLSSVSQ